MPAESSKSNYQMTMKHAKETKISSSSTTTYGISTYRLPYQRRNALDLLATQDISSFVAINSGDVTRPDNTRRSYSAQITSTSSEKSTTSSAIADSILPDASLQITSGGPHLTKMLLGTSRHAISARSTLSTKWFYRPL